MKRLGLTSRLCTIAGASILLAACEENPFASNFQKFASCVDNNNKSGLIQSDVVKQVCARKYARALPNDDDVEGKVRIPTCDNDGCNIVVMFGTNKTKRTIVTEIAVKITSKGRVVQGIAEPLWAEPGQEFSHRIQTDGRFPRPSSQSDFDWVMTSVKGIEIDG